MTAPWLLGGLRLAFQTRTWEGESPAVATPQHPRVHAPGPAWPLPLPLTAPLDPLWMVPSSHLAFAVQEKKNYSFIMELLLLPQVWF